MKHLFSLFTNNVFSSFFCRRCLKGFSKPLLKSNTTNLDTTWTTSTRSFKCSRIEMKIKQFFVAEREWPFSHFPLAFYFIFLSTLFYNRPSAWRVKYSYTTLYSKSKHVMLKYVVTEKYSREDEVGVFKDETPMSRGNHRKEVRCFD